MSDSHGAVASVALGSRDATVNAVNAGTSATYQGRDIRIGATDAGAAVLIPVMRLDAASLAAQVQAFLTQQLRFTDIARLNAQCLDHFSGFHVSTLDDILALDLQARHYAQSLLRKGL